MSVAKKLLSKNVPVICQDEIVPLKLRNYLQRHLEITAKLSRNKTVQLRVTKLTEHYKQLARSWFWKSAKLRQITL